MGWRQVVPFWEGQASDRASLLLPNYCPLSRVYGGSDELSDDITQQQLLPGVK